MKKIKTILLSAIMMCFCGGLALAPSGAVWADEPTDTSGETSKTVTNTTDDCSGEGQVETNILGGGGCYDTKDGISNILKWVLNILSIGVGVVAVIGLVIAAIQYITAGSNEAQLAKAKTRILEIIIGLAIYAMAWAAMNWLIPGFSLDVNLGT